MIHKKIDPMISAGLLFLTATLMPTVGLAQNFSTPPPVPSSPSVSTHLSDSAPVEFGISDQPQQWSASDTMPHESVGAGHAMGDTPRHDQHPMQGGKLLHGGHQMYDGHAGHEGQAPMHNGQHNAHTYGQPEPDPNYFHLLHPQAHNRTPPAERKMDPRPTAAELQASFCRAGNPHWLSNRAALTYDQQYQGYFVGGGVPPGPFLHSQRGDHRHADERTWGMDYAPWHSRVALNWSHGRLYQGGIGTYEPDRKNHPLFGQAYGRRFANRDRVAKEDYEPMHEEHFYGEEN